MTSEQIEARIAKLEAISRVNSEHILELRSFKTLVQNQLKAVWEKIKGAKKVAAEARQHVDAMAGHGIGASYRAPETILYSDTTMPRIATHQEAVLAIHDARVKASLAPGDAPLTDGTLAIEHQTPPDTSCGLCDHRFEDHNEHGCQVIEGNPNDRECCDCREFV